MRRLTRLALLIVLLFLFVSVSSLTIVASPTLHTGRRIVFDAHVDPVGRLYTWRTSLADTYSSDQVDIAKWRAGGINIVWVAIWVNPRWYSGHAAFEHAKALIDYLEHDIHQNRTHLALCRSADECLAACAKGKIAILLGLEGGEPLLCSPEMVDYFASRGIKRITLTWRGNLEWAGSSEEWDQTPIRRPKGLNATGLEIIRRMNENGIVVDLSHTSTLTASEAIEASRKPCIFSHSNAYALCPHPRNVPDQLLKRLAQKGGVIGVNFHSAFLVRGKPGRTGDKNVTASIDDVVRHIDHIRAVAGIDHIGIGSDWDGDIRPAQGLEEASKLPQLWEALKKRGYIEDEISKIAGLNFLRVLRENEN